MKLLLGLSLILHAALSSAFVHLVSSRLNEESRAFPNWLQHADGVSINTYLESRRFGNGFLLPFSLMHSYTSNINCRINSMDDCNTLMDTAEFKFNKLDYYSAISIAIGVLCNHIDIVSPNTPYPACIIRSILILMESEREIGNMNHSIEYLNILINHKPTASTVLKNRLYPLRIRSALSLKPIPVSESTARSERQQVVNQLSGILQEININNITISLYVRQMYD